MPVSKTLTIVLIVALLVAVAPASAATGTPGVHTPGVRITSVTIEPNGPDLNITMHYSTGLTTKIFSLLFGARVVQPAIADQLAAFGDPKLVSIDPYGETAKLVARDQGQLADGVYLYDRGATFPAAVDVLEIRGRSVDRPLIVNDTTTVPAFSYHP